MSTGRKWRGSLDRLDSQNRGSRVKPRLSDDPHFQVMLRALIDGSYNIVPLARCASLSVSEL